MGFGKKSWSNMNNRIRWMGLYIVAWTYSCVIGVHTEHLYPKTHVLFPTNWMDFLASKNPSTESGKTIEVKSPSTHHGSIFFIQVDNPLLLAVALSHYHKAYFSGLCKGISPQTMAWNMVRLRTSILGSWNSHRLKDLSGEIIIFHYPELR